MSDGDHDDALTIDHAGGPIPIPVTFDGSGGVDVVHGPAVDVIWTVTGPGEGTVGSVSFAGVEHLVGAAGNEDTFVFEAAGSLLGTVEGGDGGYDTLVVVGGSASVVSTITGPQSGTVSRGADVITYAGLEPITIVTSGSEVTITGTAGDDVFTVEDDGTANSFQVTCSCGETHTVTNASTVTKLTINAGGGNDTINLVSVDAQFTGQLVFGGGADVDTLTVADAPGAWHITAVNAGTYKPTTGTGASFSEIENLVGAATAADSFEFDSGAGLSGTIDDGAGTLTVSAVGFVRISGDSLDFVQQTHTVTPSDGTPVAANVLTVSGPGGAGQTGFIGVEALGISVGLQGQLGAFALGIFTAGTRAWHAFDGTIDSPTITGLEGLDILIDSLTVVLYDTAADGTWLNHSANPLSVGTKTFNSPSALLSVSVPAQVTVEDFLYASGTFTFARGGTMNVDVATGLGGTPPPTLQAALDALPILSSDTGALGRSADYSVIYNLPVRSFQIAATNVNVFFGTAFAWVDGSNGGTANGLIEEVELGPDTTGFYAGGVDIGVLLLSGQPTGLAAFDSAIHPRFFALSGTAAELGVVNIPGFSLEGRGITLEVNQGTPWAPGVPGAPPPVIDWRLSFPDTASDPDTDPDGFQLVTPDGPVVFGLAGPVIGASAAHVVLEIGDNVFVSGAFSFRMGEVETVTVEQGGLLPDITGLNVRTIKIGAEGVSVFLGDGLADYDIDADIADYLSTDAPAVVLVGETVGNLVDGKVYRRVGSTLGSPDRAGVGSVAGLAGLFGRVGLAAAGGRFRGWRHGGGRGRADGWGVRRDVGQLPRVRAARAARWRAACCRAWWPTMWAPIGSSCRCSSTVTARSTWTSWARTRSASLSRTRRSVWCWRRRRPRRACRSTTSTGRSRLRL